MTNSNVQDVAARAAEDSGEEEEGGEPEDKRAESLRMMPDTEENRAEDAGGGVGGGGVTETRMSRSVSDSTLRRHALHLNLTSASSVLPSFTPLHQFKVG